MPKRSDAQGVTGQGITRRRIDDSAATTWFSVTDWTNHTATRELRGATPGKTWNFSRAG